jgi:hypothetical protein
MSKKTADPYYKNKYITHGAINGNTPLQRASMNVLLL